MAGHSNVTYVGGVGIVAPGDSANVTVLLEPGTYVLECDIPGMAGPHAEHGMMKELDVTGTPTGAAEPTADLTLTLKEYAFGWSASPTAGKHVVKVENKGAMPHEAPIFHLASNKTIQDFLAWEQSPQGPPPVTDMFGGAALSPGRVEYASVTFVAGGSYGMVCFLPDENKVPHLAHGMVTQFTVA
jgi:uncharacterized cupredoxin-like copper-binding protein